MGAYNSLPQGAIAQLVERLHGMQEVSGSTPLSSTKSFKDWIPETRLTGFLVSSFQGNLKNLRPHRLEA